MDNMNLATGNHVNLNIQDLKLHDSLKSTKL